MRAPICIVLLLFGSVSCMSPLAATALQAARGPTALAAPMEDGSVYVLAEGGPLTSNATLKSVWRREASKACHGEYMVMSELDGQSQAGGVVGRRSYEGFVRCVSAEGMGLDADQAPTRSG